MYTVILYLKEEETPVEKYRFLFYSLQEDNQLYLCPWKRGANGAYEEARHILNVLNEITQSHQEWKLILYGGMAKVTESYLREEMPEEVRTLIQLYSGIRSESGMTIMGSFPEYVYYVVGSFVQFPTARKDSELFTIDREGSLGKRFRMFRFRVDASCEKNRLFDLFRLNCALLALAVNEIPSAVTEYGYLYHLDLEIDQDLFGKYMMEQDRIIDEMRKYLEFEADRLQNQKNMGDGYPPEISFKDNLKRCNDSLEKGGSITKLRRKDLRRMAGLNEKLDKNMKWVRSRLSFPKGVLRKEASKMQEMVENEPGAGDFLSEAGRDKIEREIDDKLERICRTKTIQLSQGKFLDDFRRKDEIIRQCARKKMTPGIKAMTCLILTVMQMIMIMPFILYSWKEGKEGRTENLIYKIMDQVNKGTGILQNGITGWLTAGFFFFLLCITLVFAVVLVLGTWYEWNILRNYHNHIFNGISKKQRQKAAYFEKIINLLAEYQYYIRLLREQRQREEKWEEDRRRLSRHRSTWKQSHAVCQQLRTFLDEREAFAELPASAVGIHGEPRQTEYYWIPFKDNKGMAELNRSGSYLKVLFYFVTRIQIRKQYAE